MRGGDVPAAIRQHQHQPPVRIVLPLGAVRDALCDPRRRMHQRVVGRIFGFRDGLPRNLRKLRKFSLTRVHFRSFRDFRGGGSRD